MPYQNLESYTETDPLGHITPSGFKVDWSGVTRDEDTYLYSDKGVDHFDGDFEHLYEIYHDSATPQGGTVTPWMLSNDIDDEWGLVTNSKNHLSLSLQHSPGVICALYLRENDSGTLYQDSNVALSFDTPYYLKIKRDESVGVYGTLYCYIYSDAARTTLVDTLSVTLHTSKKDFRYVWAFDSFDSNDTNTSTGYGQNLDLQEPSLGYASGLLLLGVG